MRPTRFLTMLALAAAPLVAQAPATLTITGPDGATVEMAPARLRALPRVSGAASAHETKFTFEGTDLREVLRASGVTPVDSLRGPLLRRVLLIVGSDGYAAAIALSDLDPSIGGRRAILVDREDGAVLPAARGPFRVIVEGDARPTRWVRNVVRIEVVDLK